jgi:hypothetical protein
MKHVVITSEHFHHTLEQTTVVHECGFVYKCRHYMLIIRLYKHPFIIKHIDNRDCRAFRCSSIIKNWRETIDNFYKIKLIMDIEINNKNNQWFNFENKLINII